MLIQGKFAGFSVSCRPAARFRSRIGKQEKPGTLGFLGEFAICDSPLGPIYGLFGLIDSVWLSTAGSFPRLGRRSAPHLLLASRPRHLPVSSCSTAALSAVAGFGAGNGRGPRAVLDHP
jgi:hypothetical protein